MIRHLLALLLVIGVLTTMHCVSTDRTTSGVLALLITVLIAFIYDR